MALPPIPMGPPGGDLESPTEDAGEPGEEAGDTSLDPQFAAELSKCSYFSDASDEDLACVQRAVLGLVGRG